MKFFSKLWKIITCVRNGLANCIFLLLIILVLVVVLMPKQAPLPDQAPLLLEISGVLVDKRTYQPSILDLFSSDEHNRETQVSDVVAAIRHASNDRRITGLILNMNYLQHGSLSKMQEIGQAINEFKQSQKPVIAYGDGLSQGQYFLASFADTIYMNPLGSVGVIGFGLYGSYFKEAADKLSVKFHLFKVGDYKDAAEPFVRNDMSAASREHNANWINQLWGSYTGTIETNRQLDSGTLQNFIEGLPASVQTSDEDYAQLAVKAGLIDGLISRAELTQQLMQQFGSTSDGDSLLAIDLNRYLDEIQAARTSSPNKIGLIVATGTIVDGYGEAGTIGGDELSDLIHQAIQDKTLQALVIRIDTGGGSAYASEVIRDQIQRARAEGLAIYLSMGSVAASGGYWLATAANEIWAQPDTITGSIGVWGLVPNISESLTRIGIHNDGIGTTSLADIYTISRPLSPQAQLVFQGGVNQIYTKFIAIVAEARGQTPAAIHQLAQGRVWTGMQARELGLVDQLGSLKDLLTYVAETLNIDNYSIKVIEPQLSPSEQFMRALMQQAEHVGEAVQARIVGEDLADLRRSVAPYTSALQINAKGDRQTILAECLFCVAP